MQNILVKRGLLNYAHLSELEHHLNRKNKHLISPVTRFCFLTNGALRVLRSDAFKFLQLINFGNEHSDETCFFRAYYTYHTLVVLVGKSDIGYFLVNLFVRTQIL